MVDLLVNMDLHCVAFTLLIFSIYTDSTAFNYSRILIGGAFPLIDFHDFFFCLALVDIYILLWFCD